MTKNKVKRTFYISPETNDILNKYVNYYHETITGSTYGGASAAANEAFTAHCGSALADLDRRRTGTHNFFGLNEKEKPTDE